MANNNVRFIKVKLQETYDVLDVKDSHALYWVEESKRLYCGETLFGTGALVGELAGLMSVEDKKRFDELVSSPTSGLSPVAGDGIVINNNVIEVNISDNAHGLAAVNGALTINLATTETDGAMSAADKKALDTLVALGVVDNYVTKTEAQAIFDKITSAEESFTWTEM